MRKTPGASANNLTGNLLVAHPSLLDPNFRRTVLLISSHDEEHGAHGVIINRPSGQCVGDLLADEDTGALAGVPVFLGGPVAPNQLMVAAIALRPEVGTLKLGQTLSLDEARELIGDESDAVRAFIGYAGWAANQIESELAQKAWIVRKPDRESLKLENAKDLWFRIMRELGPAFRLLAAVPDDPSLN